MEITRDFTVATFVVHQGRVLLLYHRRLGMWLPPGGHIEPNELPDEAAVREVYEETGVQVELVGERALPIEYPRQLIRPWGVQVEQIGPGHEHIDLVYFARPVGSVALRPNHEVSHVDWYGPEQLARLPLTDEIRMWVDLARKKVGDTSGQRR